VKLNNKVRTASNRIVQSYDVTSLISLNMN